MVENRASIDSYNIEKTLCIVEQIMNAMITRRLEKDTRIKKEKKC